MTFVIIAVIALVFVFFAIVNSGNSKNNGRVIDSSRGSKQLPIRPDKKSGSVSVSMKEINRYAHGSLLPESARKKYLEASFKGLNHIELTKQEHADFKTSVALHILKDTEWKTLISLKTEAQGLEKSGSLSAAFDSYSKLLRFVASSRTLTPKNYLHDINRLRIVAKKLQRKSEFEKLIQSLGLPTVTK